MTSSAACEHAPAQGAEVLTFESALLLVGTSTPVRDRTGRTGELISVGTGYAGDETVTVRWSDETETTTHPAEIERVTE